MELALFNSDILFKIATYLPVDGLRQLSLTCRRLGIGCDDSLSLIEETARRIVQDIEQRKRWLPCQRMTETIGYANIIFCYQ